MEIIFDHKVASAGENKKGVLWKNPSSAICEVNADISAMYGRMGVKKFRLRHRMLRN